MNAFWSVTTYDGRTQRLIENPIGRYLVDSPMLPVMKMNPDGSPTIYVQKDSPGKAKEANWLPASDGTSLPRDALVLAEGRAAIDPASRRGLVGAACGGEGERTRPSGSGVAAGQPLLVSARRAGCTAGLRAGVSSTGWRRRGHAIAVRRSR